MKPSKKYIVAIFIPMMMSSLFASTWTCQIADKNGTIWEGKHRYQLPAKMNALHLCKNESRSPMSCVRTKETCTETEEEVSSKSYWQCTAFDQMGKEWSAEPLKNRDDAAIQAKESCLNESGFPDTCYVNLLTCRDITLEDL